MSGDSKEIASTKLDGASAGNKSGDGSGPTGSSRSYPKGGSVSLKADWNPQKIKPAGWGVGGV